LVQKSPGQGEWLIATIVSPRYQKGRAGEVKARYFAGDSREFVSDKKGRYGEGGEGNNPATKVASSLGKDLGKKSNCTIAR
jgi:hypothetical protein